MSEHFGSMYGGGSLSQPGALESFNGAEGCHSHFSPDMLFLVTGLSPNAVCLYYKPEAGGGENHCYDFASLYPYVNETKEYPIGDPPIIYRHFLPLSYYFGIARFKVLPPCGLYFPMLPFRAVGKLMFPVCCTWVEGKQLEHCTHREEERASEGTRSATEFLKAEEKGYKVLTMSES